jgi:hypothetical protein
VLRNIFGPKRDEDGSWRKLHNNELHGLYSPHIVRVIKSRIMKWDGHVARMGRGEVLSVFLVGRLQGKGPLRRPRRREMGIDVANWIQLSQDSVQCRACVNTVMNLRVA